LVKVLAPLIIVMAFFAASSKPCRAAGANTLAVSATVVSKSQSRFNTVASTLNFGNLDPLTGVDVVVSTTIIFRCGGSANPATFFISDEDGLYETGPNATRMRHATIISEYLPYSLALNPASGTVPKNINQTLTVTGVVRSVDLQTVAAGSYADTVVLSILP
jgi:spore coat protein U-like protein